MLFKHFVSLQNSMDTTTAMRPAATTAIEVAMAMMTPPFDVLEPPSSGLEGVGPSLLEDRAGGSGLFTS